MSIGLYEIRNVSNGKFYIGSSINIERRWKNDHHRTLKQGTHPNRHLQRAWNKFGEESFELSILGICDKEHLLNIEQSLLDRYANTEWCYNIAKNAQAPGTGIIPSKETKLKMSQSLTGRIRSLEHRKHLSESLKGSIISKETREKISKKLLGKIESDETRRRKSITWQGRTNNPNAHLVESDILEIRKRYEGNKSNRKYKMILANEYEVQWNTIHRIVKRKTWKHI